MRRPAVAVVLATVFLAVQAIPALGGEQWCEEDPILTIDGRTVDYTASFPATNVAGTTVHWTFHIPSNVLSASAITPPAIGSPAIPSTVRIYRDLPPYSLLATARVVTTVTFSASGSFPTATAVKGLNAAWTTYYGRSNRTLTFATGYSALPLAR
jgi:hypothetical protein